MDWYKSKKILIIALLITNIVLFGYLSFNYYQNRDETTTSAFVKEVSQLLAEKDIKIHEDAYIPKNKNKLPSLRVEFESYSASDINKRFFNSSGYIEEPNSGYTKINSGNELVGIINSRTIRYENSNKNGSLNISDTAQAENLAENFLIEKDFDISNMKCTFRSEEDGKYNLIYSKTFDDVVIERSYTKFVIDKKIGVVSMDRLWLNVIDKSQTDISLSSAPRALLTLLDDSSNYGKTIVEIDECYYFDPEAQGYLEAIQGRAIPAWRIQFSDGENVEVDNY